MADDWQRAAGRRPQPEPIDTAAPNAARVADALNGGRDNFEADRWAARLMTASAPAIGAIVPAVLAFHRRAVRFLVREAGIRQFLDVGTGIPEVAAERNIAQSIDPSCRIVHVDNDPMVLSHLRAFARSTAQGAIAALDAKITDPAAILAGSAGTLDFLRPVAVLLPSTLPFIPDTDRAAHLVARLLAALAPGSYLALCHVASDLDPAVESGVEQWNQMSPLRFTLRTRAEVARLTAGLDLVEPGLVPADEWRPESSGSRPRLQAPVYAVLGRKPAAC